MQEQPIGAKIHYYRKRAEMSQLELETAIDASPGSISRIESGKVNPTKETLQAIANFLRLDDTEKNDLFGLHSLLPTEEEVAAAIAEVKPFFSNSNVYAYLLDEWANFYAASLGITDLLNLSPGKLKLLQGKNMMEIMIDPHYGVRQLFDDRHFAEMYANEIARTRMEVNLEKHFPEMLQRLQKLPGFKQIWQLSNDTQKIFSQSAKIVHMEINGQRLKFSYARERLKGNARFEIIEIHSPQPY